MNSVVISGRLTKDPETRVTQSGKKMLTVDIARDKVFKENKKTLYFRVVCFGQSAEFLERYAGQGDLIGVEGELDINVWTDNSNTSHKDWQIQARRVELLSRKGKQNLESSDNAETRSGSRRSYMPPAEENRVQGSIYTADPIDITDEDLPF